MKVSDQPCVRCGKPSDFVKGSILDEKRGVHIGGSWCSEICLFQMSAEFESHRKHCGYSYCLGIKKNSEVKTKGAPNPNLTLKSCRTCKYENKKHCEFWGRGCGDIIECGVVG